MRKKLLAVLSLAFAAALSTGIAVSASAETEPTKLDGFAINGVSIRTENFKDEQGEEIENSTGIRFKTVTPEAKETYEGARVVTTLTIDGFDSKDVAAQAWRTDSNGWNTVLVGIPKEHYTTQVTAQSFIYLNETAYKTDPVTSSIALAASQALNLGKATEEQVGKYVEGVVTGITLNKTETVSIVEGDAVQLTATTQPEGYSVVWSSSDEAVATVDNTGKVVMQAASGSATITATMSGKTASVEVTSAGMAKVLHFDNGVNNYITPLDNDTAVCVGPRVKAEEGVAAATATGTLKYDPTNWEFEIGIDAAYLANVFAEASVSALSFKMYTIKDGLTNTASNAYVAFSTANGSATVWSGVGTVTDKGDYLACTIVRTAYEKWVANHSEGVPADAKLQLQVRLGQLNAEGKLQYCAVDYVYLDDFMPVYPTGDFEDGDASFIGSGLIANNAALNRVNLTTALVTEDGNTRLSLNSSNWNMAVIIDDAFLARIFADTAVNGLQFKVYCAADEGYASGTNGQVCYMGTDNKTVRAQWGGYPVSAKTEDGYFTIEIQRKWYNDWLTAKGDVVSDMYIQMRLGKWDETTQKYVLQNSGSPATVYLDDFVAVK